MNWLDVVIAIIMAIVIIGGFILFTIGAKEDEIGGGFIALLITLGIAGLIGFLSWFSLDYKSGSTVGEITSVDKNLFGTTAVFIKTTANQEEKYCIESDELAKQASELVGKKVKINYGKRIGFYSTGACNNAPIDEIIVVE